MTCCVLLSKTKDCKIMLFITATQHKINLTNKIRQDDIKEELLGSLIETEDEDELRAGRRNEKYKEGGEDDQYH